MISWFLLNPGDKIGLDEDPKEYVEEKVGLNDLKEEATEGSGLNLGAVALLKVNTVGPSSSEDEEDDDDDSELKSE